MLVSEMYDHLLLFSEFEAAIFVDLRNETSIRVGFRIETAIFIFVGFRIEAAIFVGFQK